MGFPHREATDVAPATWWSGPKPAGERARLTVGAMNFGKRTPERDAARIVDRAIERGVTFFDTANAYGNGESERILGRLLHGRRESTQIATKVGFLGPGRSDKLTAARLAQALAESLDRLGTTYVDVYYLHVPDHDTPIAETVAGMAPLLASGQVRAWGVSNYASWQMVEIAHACDATAVARPVIAQHLYNALITQLDIEYFRFARTYGIHTTVYNPLAGGLLSGRYAASSLLAGEAPASGSRFDKNGFYLRRYWTPSMFQRVEQLKALAETHGLTLLELSYAWLAAHPSVDSILVGPGSIEHLDAALDACEKHVPEDLRRSVRELQQEWAGTDTFYAR